MGTSPIPDPPIDLARLAPPGDTPPGSGNPLPGQDFSPGAQKTTSLGSSPPSVVAPGTSKQGFIESEILGYVALSKLAEDVAKLVTLVDRHIPPAGGDQDGGKLARADEPYGPIMLLTGENESALLMYQALEEQVKAIELAYDDIQVATEPDPDDVPMRFGPDVTKGPKVDTVSTPWLEVASKIVDLLRIDVTASPSEYAVDDEAFVAQVGGRLTVKRWTVRVASVSLPSHRQPASEGKDSVGGLLASLAGARARAAQRVAASKLPQDHSEKLRLASIRDVHAQLERALTTADARSGVTPLAVLVRGAAVARALQGAKYVLLVKVSRLGGTTRTTRVLFFTRITHSGGAIVRFSLRTAQGALLVSDTRWCYQGFVSFATKKRDNLESVGDPTDARHWAPHDTIEGKAGTTAAPVRPAY